MKDWTRITRLIGKPRHRRLIFHIGDQKTGTSTIQNALAAGKVHIEGKKLLYPAKVAHNYLSAHVMAAARGDALPPNRPGMPGLRQIRDEIRASHPDYVILSGEGFADIDQQAFYDVLAKHLLGLFDEFRLIAYVRPHAARVLASFTEQSKVGLAFGTMEQFHARSLANRRFFYQPRFQEWRRLYGSDFILRPMVLSALDEGSVLPDFLHFALDGAGYSLDPVPDANIALCLEDLVTIRYLQARLRKLGKPLRLGFGWHLAMAMGAVPRHGPSTKIALHRSLAEQIHADYIEDARAMDAEFFADTPMMVRELEEAVETALPAPQPLEPEAYFGADELRNLDVIAELLAAMFSREGVKWPPFFRALREQEIEALHDR